MKRFAAEERKFWKSKHKFEKKLDIEEREKIVLLKEDAMLDIEEREKKVLLKENEQETLRRQLTKQMAMVDEKERINVRNGIAMHDKEAEMFSAKVELKREKKDVVQQKKKYDHMLHLLETKKVRIVEVIRTGINV